MIDRIPVPAADHDVPWSIGPAFRFGTAAGTETPPYTVAQPPLSTCINIGCRDIACLISSNAQHPTRTSNENTHAPTPALASCHPGARSARETRAAALPHRLAPAARAGGPPSERRREGGGRHAGRRRARGGEGRGHAALRREVGEDGRAGRRDSAL